MTDRFDEMAGRVQMDLAAFAMPTGTSARRVIADALRAAHAGGVDEAAATIDQLRADIEKLRDDRADLQERCNRLMAERNAAVHMVASADSEWKVRAEKAERERDEWKARHDTLADVSRKCIATAERERDEARAERDARPDISAEDAALVRDVSGLVGVSRVYRALMVHAAKAVRP